MSVETRISKFQRRLQKRLRQVNAQLALETVAIEKDR